MKRNIRFILQSICKISIFCFFLIGDLGARPYPNIEFRRSVKSDWLDIVLLYKRTELEKHEELERRNVVSFINMAESGEFFVAYDTRKHKVALCRRIFSVETPGKINYLKSWFKKENRRKEKRKIIASGAGLLENSNIFNIYANKIVWQEDSVYWSQRVRNIWEIYDNQSYVYCGDSYEDPAYAHKFRLKSFFQKRALKAMAERVMFRVKQKRAQRRGLGKFSHFMYFFYDSEDDITEHESMTRRFTYVIKHVQEAFGQESEKLISTYYTQNSKLQTVLLWKLKI